MAVPTSKNELLSAIYLSFDKLNHDLARVPESRADECSMPGYSAGTMMSPANLVSYLVGWNALVLKWLHQDERGISIDFPETDFKWNQLGLLAQKFYADYVDLSWAELTERLMAVKTKLTGAIASRTGRMVREMDQRPNDTAQYGFPLRQCSGKNQKVVNLIRSCPGYQKSWGSGILSTSKYGLTAL